MRLHKGGAPGATKHAFNFTIFDTGEFVVGSKDDNYFDSNTLSHLCRQTITKPDA